MKTYEFTVKLVTDDAVLKVEIKAESLQEAISKFYKKTSDLFLAEVDVKEVNCYIPLGM